MDCPSKEVVLHALDGQRMCFIGERKITPSCRILALTVDRLIWKGCEAFLACAISTEGSSMSLDDISIVCRFLDVFSEELPGLPPNRKIEFSIDLNPNTILIARASYRMAPAKLKELKV